jgi:phosphoribosylformylglycinamidine (FGAM) synthase-like enzyme
LQAEVVGEVTDDGLFRNVPDGEEIACISVSALTDNAQHMSARRDNHHFADGGT